jgi:ABC-type transporter Mla subunit MlaD
VYASGSALPDHAVIHEDSTQIPVEVDQVYASLNDLSAALGPQGANSKGALSQLLTVIAKNLNGNGQALHDSIGGLSQAVSTLANSRGNISASVNNLSQISQTLDNDDPQVRRLARLLATVSTELNRQDSDLTMASKRLNGAFTDVARFVGHNRSALTSNVADLTDVSKTIADHKDAVAAALDLAPLALTDLWNSYVPENWDISHPVGVNINGMTTATTARGNLFEDLFDQLGFSLSGFCASLPPQDAKKLSALCTALAQSSGGLSGLLGGLANASAPKPGAPSYAPSFAGLMLAGTR